MSSVYGTSELLEVSNGMLMMKKQHFDSSVQTAIQTQLAPYYGQDAKRVRHRSLGRA